MRIALGGRSSALVALCMLLALFTVCTHRANAQANSSVTGVVTDSTGGVLVGATVTLINSTINFSASTTTNDIGVYEFVNVPPAANYTLTFTKDGFQTITIDKVSLTVGTKETRDAKLGVGGTTQAVEVTATATATLDTTDANIGTVVDGDRVQDLPSLFVNNAALFLALAPGVQSTGDVSQTGVVTGTRADQTNFTLDGLDVNDQRNGEAFTTTVSTPLDSIQELRTTVGGDDASYGHSAGGQVELVTKSGTNQFHGQAYDFNRVTVLAANDFFNNLNGIARPPLIRNQFGGDVGGPILKNRLFFFFSYSGLRSKGSQENDDIVPLAAFRDGQLNYINNQNQIATTPASGPGSLGALDPSGVGADPALLSLITSRPYPISNNLGVGDGLNSGGFQFVSPADNDQNTYVGRVDYQPSTNHRVFARGTWDRWLNGDSINHQIQSFPNDPVPEASIVNHSRSWVVGDSWIVSTNITNQISFGETNSLLVFPLNYAPTFPNLLSFAFNGTPLTSPYDVTIGGGPNPSLNEQFPIVPVYQFRDTFTWSKGKHTYQLGGTVKPTIFKSGNLTDTNLFSMGLGGNLTSLNATLRPADISTTNGFATNEWDTFFPLILGRYASVAAGYNYDRAGNAQTQGIVPPRDYHSTEYEFFAQDVWNIRAGLTLTYGLRWEFHNPLSEVNGFEAVPNLSANQIFAIRQQDAAAGIEGPNAVPFVTYGLGGSANHAPGYYRSSYTDFAPRLGLAYSPSYKDGFLGQVFGDRKTSIRAGFGINDDVSLIGQGFELDETSFLFSNTVLDSFGGGGANVAFLPVSQGGDPRFTGLSSLLPVPPGGTISRPSFTPNVDSNGYPIGFGTGNGFGQGGLFNFDPNYKTPYEMSFSLGFQRELPGNWLVDVSYFGKLGRRLTALGDPAQTLNFKDAASNQFLYSAFGAAQKQLQSGTPIGSLTPQPWFENQVGAAVAQLAPGLTCPALSNFFFAPATPNFDCTNLTAEVVGSVLPNGDVSSTIVGLALIHPTGNPEQSLIPANVGLLAQDGAAGFIGNFSSSNYHSLLVRLNHTLSHDLTMEFDYAFAHSIDNDSGVQNSLISFADAEVCDLRNLRVCRGNSNFDARHTVAANFEYGLPFGHGRSLANSSPKWLNEIIGGWHVSGIVTAHTGFPFKIDSGTWPVDFTQTAPAVFVGTQADVQRGIHTVAPTQAGQSPSVQYFANENTALGAFAFPFGGGTGTRNIVRGPGFWDVDLAILKDFPMPWSDTHKLQFRAEGINAFNHVNFSPPGASLLAPQTFGNISSDVNGPRNVQLALKYSF